MALSAWLADKTRQRARAWIFKEMRRTVLPRACAGLGRCLPNDSQSRDLT